MKKGFLAAVAALAIAIATPVTVHAVDGGTAPSPTAKDGRILLVEQDGNGGIKKGMTAAEVNTAWGTSFDTSLVVVWVGNAYVDPEGATTADPIKPAASEYGGTIIAHQSSKEGKKVTSGPTITLTVDDLSPVIFLAPASSSKVPNTGDSNSNALWIGALGLSVVLAGVAIFMRKRTA